MQDAEASLAQNAGRGRGHRQGFRLSTAEKLAIERHSVDTVIRYLEGLGYRVRDVGAAESFDLLADREGHELRVEVKGTVSDGTEIILTRNEVELHLRHHPDNALAIVRYIRLDRSTQSPAASAGELIFESPWTVAEQRLRPIAYRYLTALAP